MSLLQTFDEIIKNRITNMLKSIKTNQKQAIDKTYYDRMQDVLDQINQENALAEQFHQT